MGLKKLLNSREGWSDYQERVKEFADLYGLLGLLQETVSAPILPSRVEDSLFPLVAPDALIDGGRLRKIDPATEGKERLEALFYERYGPSRRTGRKVQLDSNRLALPQELRFLTKGLTPFGRFESPLESFGPETLSWEEVGDVYGIHVILDKEAERGWSFVSTREPLSFWDTEVERFPSPPCSPESLVRHMESVTPHPVPGRDGKPRPGLRCPSLLKALYAMLYMDATNDRELKKCKAEDCPEWFAVGTRDKARKFCPHPEDPRKQSKCGQKATTEKHRQKQRQKTDAV